MDTKPTRLQTDDSIITTVSQILPHQAEVGESAEAEPTHPTMDQVEDWEYHSVCAQKPPSHPYKHLRIFEERRDM
jgi:hypothetical protein